ncbi:hypothetical protein [Amycolatopsis sacchari]|uniref:hypothetical protein n=1 Tax=Amycolatopsis sacchari TaxID=115433 RepID=UPI001FE6F8AB|nr:hypothetical protein [Amycolatopsis sacchari]
MPVVELTDEAGRVDEQDIENHPDLRDPDWQRHAVKEAWVDYRRDRRRAKLGKRLAITAVVAVVLAGAGVAFYYWGKTHAETAADATSGGGTSTTTAPSVIPEFARVDLSHPFDKTPAQNWREGIEGVTFPAAVKVGGFSEKQVATALDQVKQAIVLTSLDADVLQGHRPDKFLALLAPDIRDQVRTDADRYLTYLTIDPPLLPVPARMSGAVTMTPRGQQELVLHVDYVTAYAFDPGSRTITSPGDMEPFIRVQADFVAERGEKYLYLENRGGYYSNIACEASKRNLIAPSFTEPDFAGPSLTQEPGQYDPTKPLPTEDNCG